MNNIKQRLELHPLNITGTWVTEAEIYTTALMLKRNIYIYIADQST